MLDMGFIKPIRSIAAMVSKKRQTMLFSATMPKEIRHLADSLLVDPVRVEVAAVASAAPKIEQRVHHVSRDLKQSLLERLLESNDMTSVVVFTRTKHGADRVMKRLIRARIDAAAIHGNKNQSQRQRALDAFKAGKTRVLVATDVAARGIDVDSISHVVNFDIPVEAESYVHRIGRTGRAGATGIAIAFCEPAERGALKAIEKLLGKAVPVAPLPEGLTVLSAINDAAEAHAPRREHPHSPRRPAAGGGGRSSGRGGSGGRASSGGSSGGKAAPKSEGWSKGQSEGASDGKSEGKSDGRGRGGPAQGRGGAKTKVARSSSSEFGTAPAKAAPPTRGDDGAKPHPRAHAFPSARPAPRGGSRGRR
jgi:ATP-dependent RNA helicase RhlE